MQKPGLIHKPTVIQPPGDQIKVIEEYVGLVNTGTDEISIAHMHTPGGWAESGQCPEFNEYTVVLKGLLRVEFLEGVIDVGAGQAVIAHRGEWVRYSTPNPEGAEYISVCLPAFSPQRVNRDD